MAVSAARRHLVGLSADHRSVFNSLRVAFYGGTQSKLVTLAPDAWVSSTLVSLEEKSSRLVCHCEHCGIQVSLAIVDDPRLIECSMIPANQTHEGLVTRATHRIPRANPQIPVTRTHGCGFLRVRVRVNSKTPMGHPCPSLHVDHNNYYLLLFNGEPCPFVARPIPLNGQFPGLNFLDPA